MTSRASHIVAGMCETMNRLGTREPTDENGNLLQWTRNSVIGRKPGLQSLDCSRSRATFLCAALFAVPAAAAVIVPITFKYAGTFEVTPGDPSPCEGVPITDTLTGTGSHLGRLTATYPHCVNFVAGTFSGTATFTAANGDQLFVLLGGEADDPACTTTCGVTFRGTITGGTGRFEGAEGTLTGPGKVDLIASTITAALTGTINKDPMPF
jgi:hypothetical protein